MLNIEIHVVMTPGKHWESSPTRTIAAHEPISDVFWGTVTAPGAMTRSPPPADHRNSVISGGEMRTVWESGGRRRPCCEGRVVGGRMGGGQANARGWPARRGRREQRRERRAFGSAGGQGMAT